MASRITLALLLLSGVLGSQEKASPNGMAQPRFTRDNQLIRPEGYREWMFVGSNLGMGYNEGLPTQAAAFHHIYMQPEAYRHFRQTGEFPDKTMLVMEKVSGATDVSINRRGQFGDRFLGIEVALKDTQRFPERWAYFSFIGSGGAPLRQARPFPKEDCWNCHHKHGAVDNVFVQFYPVLRAARR